MEFVNTSESTMTIDAVSSPDFDAAEIHRTVIDKGVAKMLPVEELNIPASKSITLEPGGRAGETITIIIHLSDGNPYTVSAPVIRMSGDDHSHHH
jgi:copper(I)-binding protein